MGSNLARRACLICQVPLRVFDRFFILLCPVGKRPLLITVPWTT